MRTSPLVGPYLYPSDLREAVRCFVCATASLLLPLRGFVLPVLLIGLASAAAAQTPTAASDLRLTERDASLQVNWTAAATAPNGYRVRWRRDSDRGGALAQADVPAGTTRFTITGLTNGVVYFVRVDTKNPVDAEQPVAPNTQISARATPNPATVRGDLTGSVTEDSHAIKAEGSLRIPGNPAASFTPQTNSPGRYGSFSLTRAGSWTYILNNSDEDTNALATGATGTDAFTLTASDGTGATVTIIVNGADEPTIIAGQLTGTINVGLPDTTIRAVAVSIGCCPFVEQTNVAGSYGHFSIRENGDWTYRLDNNNPATQALAPGTLAAEVFPIQIAQFSSGQVRERTVIIITVIKASIGGQLTGSVTEDAPRTTVRGTATITGTAPFTVQTNVARSYGAFSIDAGGAWTYELDNSKAATNALAGGATVSETIPIAASDGTAGTVTITVTGADDRSRITGTLTGTVTEDDDDKDQASGTVTVTDVDTDPVPAITVQTSVAHSYGTFSIDANGGWTYELDNSKSATNALAGGASASETIAIATSDGTSANLVITVTGADDRSRITGTLTGTVTEDDDDKDQASGTVTVTDVDTDPVPAITVQTSVAHSYGTFSIDANGGWTYELDNSKSATNALAGGASASETIAIATSDGTSANLVITVTGADDRSRITGTLTGTVTEDDDDKDQASGTVTVTDVDTDPVPAITVQTSVARSYGTFSIDANGGWTYELDNSKSATNALAGGASASETIAIATSDGTSANLVITVTGADDRSRITGTLTGTVTEDDDDKDQASGTVTVTDVDTDPVPAITVQTSVARSYGTFSIDANGGWTYELDNSKSATNALAGGASASETIAIATSDGTSANLVITVTGANDLSAIGGTLTGSVTEDGEDEASGTVTVTDPDTSPAPTITAKTETGTYGTFTLRASGSWTYTLDNSKSATDALVAGARETDQFTLAASDGAEAKVTITVIGADDSSTIGGTLTGSVTEDDPSKARAEGRATLKDVDSTATFTAQTNAPGIYGTFSLEANGGWVYRLTNGAANTQALKEGQTETDTFAIATSDGVSATVTITVTGANDASTIAGTLSGTVREDASETQAQGRATLTDVDGATFTAQTNTPGTYGSFRFQADGSWTYRLNNSDPETDALTEGQMETDQFPIATSDGTGATVTITVIGANDASTIGGTLTGSVTEDDPSKTQAEGRATLTDVDGASFTVQTNAPGRYGRFSLQADGSWTYQLTDSAPETDALTEGQMETDQFPIATSDGTSATVIITVIGANDTSTIGGTLTGSVTEDDPSKTQAEGRATLTDVDGASFTVQTNAGGGYGSFSLQADGRWTYRLNNSDPETDALAEGQMETDQFPIATSDGTSATVIITVIGANDASTIGGTLTGAVTEDDPAKARAEGRATLTDIDGASFTAQTRTPGRYGSFRFEGDGTWVYRLNNDDEDTQALAAGALATDAFVIAASDGSRATVTITITGAADAGHIEGDLTGSVTEDQTTRASGRVRVTGLHEASFTAQTRISGRYGHFTLTEAGVWTYQLDNTRQATDALQQGQKAIDAFPIVASSAAQATITITVIGSHDPNPLMPTDPILEPIAGYLWTRTDLLIGDDLPGLTRFLKAPYCGCPADRQLRLTLTDDALVEVGASLAQEDLWVTLSGQWADSDQADYLFGAFGMHWPVAETALAGLMVQFDVVDLAGLDGQGGLFGPYFAARHPTQPIYFEGRLLFGVSSNDVAKGLRRGAFGTDRRLAQFRVEGDLLLDYGDIKLTPQLDARWVQDRAQAFTDNWGVPVPGQALRFGELRLGAQLAFPPRGRQDLTVTSGFSLILTREQEWTEGQTRPPAVSVARGRAELGLIYQLGDGTQLELGGSYDGLGTTASDDRSLSLGIVDKF